MYLVHLIWYYKVQKQQWIFKNKLNTWKWSVNRDLNINTKKKCEINPKTVQKLLACNFRCEWMGSIIHNWLRFFFCRLACTYFWIFFYWNDLMVAKYDFNTNWNWRVLHCFIFKRPLNAALCPVNDIKNVYIFWPHLLLFAHGFCICYLRP